MSWLTTFEHNGSEFVVAVNLFDSRIKLAQQINGQCVFLFGVVKFQLSNVSILISIVGEFDVLAELIGDCSDHYYMQSNKGFIIKSKANYFNWDGKIDS